MSDSTSSWYARKIAQARGRPAPQYQPQPQSYAPIGTPTQQWAPAPVQQAPIYSDQAKQGQASLTLLLDVQRNGGLITPGPGGRLNQEPCPNCGRELFYHDYGKKRRGPPPAPHCFNCGYNGLFEQGLESSWATP